MAMAIGMWSRQRWTVNNTSMANETQKVLNQDEKVIWQGQPQFLPYIVGSFGTSLGGIVFTAIAYAFFTISRNGGAPAGVYWVPGILILFGIYLVIGLPILRWFAYRYLYFTLTDKRAIFQSGLIGRNFDIADYDKVESATMNIGIADKMFGKNSGSIAIYANRLVSGTTSDGRGHTSSYTRNVPFVLLHISDPYTVFELFKKVSFDVKADINFPNAMRPGENAGYQTSYKQ